jgi:hypothetical protein
LTLAAGVLIKNVVAYNVHGRGVSSPMSGVMLRSVGILLLLNNPWNELLGSDLHGYAQLTGKISTLMFSTKFFLKYERNNCSPRVESDCGAVEFGVGEVIR